MATITPVPLAKLGITNQAIKFDSLNKAYRWCSHGLGRLHAVLPKETRAGLGDRLLSTSICFSGIGTPEIGDEVVSHTVGDWMNSIGADGQPIKRVPLFAFERTRACQEELLMLEGCARIVFTEVPEMLADSEIRKSCGLDGGTELSPEELRKTVPYARIKKKLWCVRKGAWCKLPYSDLHRAGSPCVEFSSMGKGLRFAGRTAKVFYVWIAMCRTLKFKIILHENVDRMGDAELKELVGDLYIIIRIVVDPPEQGWPTHRKQQICVLILREWIVVYARGLTDNEIVTKPDIDQTYHCLFRRVCNITWHDYMVASTEEIREDVQWAMNRNKVRDKEPTSAQNVLALPQSL